MGRDLYKRLADLSGHFFKLGRNLEASVDAYNKTVGTLETRVLVTARKFKDLDTTQASVELSPLAPVDQSPRALQAPELLNPKDP
jgi:DNA recombination protein RmuC